MSRRKVVSTAAALAAAVALTTSASGSPSSPLAANGRIAFSDVTGIGSMNPDGSDSVREEKGTLIISTHESMNVAFSFQP